MAENNSTLELLRIYERLDEDGWEYLLDIARETLLSSLSDGDDVDLSLDLALRLIDLLKPSASISSNGFTFTNLDGNRLKVTGPDGIEQIYTKVEPAADKNEGPKHARR